MALAALVFALAGSVNRIAFGAHFLSDVLLAWLITLTVIVVCYRVFYSGAYRVVPKAAEVRSPFGPSQAPRSEAGSGRL